MAAEYGSTIGTVYFDEFDGFAPDGSRVHKKQDLLQVPLRQAFPNVNLIRHQETAHPQPTAVPAVAPRDELQTA